MDPRLIEKQKMDQKEEKALESKRMLIPSLMRCTDSLELVLGFLPEAQLARMASVNKELSQPAERQAVFQYVATSPQHIQDLTLAKALFTQHNPDYSFIRDYFVRRFGRNKNLDLLNDYQRIRQILFRGRNWIALYQTSEIEMLFYGLLSKEILEEKINELLSAASTVAPIYLKYLAKVSPPEARLHLVSSDYSLTDEKFSARTLLLQKQGPSGQIRAYCRQAQEEKAYSVELALTPAEVKDLPFPEEKGPARILLRSDKLALVDKITELCGYRDKLFNSNQLSLPSKEEGALRSYFILKKFLDDAQFIEELWSDVVCLASLLELNQRGDLLYNQVLECLNDRNLCRDTRRAVFYIFNLTWPFITSNDFKTDAFIKKPDLFLHLNRLSDSEFVSAVRYINHLDFLKMEISFLKAAVCYIPFRLRMKSQFYVEITKRRFSSDPASSEDISPKYAAIVLSEPEVIKQLTEDDLLKLMSKTWEEVPKLISSNKVLRERMTGKLWMKLPELTKYFTNENAAFILSLPDVVRQLTDDDLLKLMDETWNEAPSLLRSNLVLKQRMTGDLWMRLVKKPTNYANVISANNEIYDLFSPEQLKKFILERHQELLLRNDDVRKRLNGVFNKQEKRRLLIRTSDEPELSDLSLIVNGLSSKEDREFYEIQRISREERGSASSLSPKQPEHKSDTSLEVKSEPEPPFLSVHRLELAMRETLKIALRKATIILLVAAGITGIATIFSPHLLALTLSLLGAALLAWSAYALLRCPQNRNRFFSSSSVPEQPKLEEGNDPCNSASFKSM